MKGQECRFLDVDCEMLKRGGTIEATEAAAFCSCLAGQVAVCALRLTLKRRRGCILWNYSRVRARR